MSNTLCTFRKSRKLHHLDFSFLFSNSNGIFYLFYFIFFIFRSFYLIEVIRASQQFNCLQGKDATPPTLFIYLTSFKDTFVIQQNLKSVTTTTRCHSYCFLCHPRILFFLRVFTILQLKKRNVLKVVEYKRTNFQTHSV